jgi:hypothetical protein
MKPESQKAVLESAKRAVKICNGVYHGAAVQVIESEIASCISRVFFIEGWQGPAVIVPITEQSNEPPTELQEGVIP